MKTLRFEGYSDDTFCCIGPRIGVDYDNCASGDPIHMLVSSGVERIIVTGQYCPGPATGWAISVAPGAEDPDVDPVPKWPMRIVQGHMPYSPRLEIDAPDDVLVQLVDEDE